MKLGEIARESRETYSGDKTGIPIVGLEHLVSQELRLTDYDIDTDNTFTKRFHKGQILFGRRRAYLKKAAIADFDGICSGDITVIEAIPGKVDPMLLPFIIQNDRLFDYAISHSAGGLSPRVKWADLADYEFDLPSLEEQRRLADKLWAAYELKEAYKKMIAATDEMVKAQFIEMFADVKTKKALCDICKPKQWPTIPTSSFTDNGYLVYGANGIIGRYHEYNHEFATITIACRGASCGAINITSPQSYITGNAMSLDYLSTDIEFDYLAYFLKCYDFRPIISGGAQPQITNTNLKRVFVPIPDIKRQQLFSIIIRQANQTTSELRQAIEKIDRVMKSLMQ